MQEVSQAYASGADDNIRNVDVKIKDLSNNVMFTSSDILSISIQKSITDGGLAIGCAQSDRISLQVFSARKMPRRTWFMVSVAFGESEKRIGIFDSDECTRDGSVINVTAYDAMYYQSKKTVQFTGSASMNLAPLTFPCLMQDVLDYLCTLRNFRTEFVCQPFTVSKLPVKDDGSFYTVRELLGFIAACHGCNVKVDMNNYLQFKAFEEVNYTADSSDVVDLTINDSDPYEVTGVLFTVDNETTIYIDDVPGSEYDEDDVGVISCFNPFATVEIAEYVWSQIGGLLYYGGSLTQRGKGIIEVGDVITTGNLKYPADSTNYRLCVTSIDYSLTSDGGFVETLGSNVEKDGSTMSSNSNDLSPSGGTGTGKWLDDDHTSAAHNDWDNNTSQGKYDSIDGYKNTATGTGSISNDILTNGGNTVTGEHNTLTRCTDTFVSGRFNDVHQAEQSIASGNGNTYYQIKYSVAIGYSSIAQYVWNSILAGHIYGGTYNGQDAPAGRISGCFICGDSFVFAPNATFSKSIYTGSGHNMTGVQDYNAVFGKNHTAGILAASLISGEGHTASGDWHAIFGEGHSVAGEYKTVCGKCGVTVNGDRLLFVVGNGTSSARQNAFTVDDSGNVNATGTITPGGADYAEYFEWADGNPENEDRRGMLVTLDGDKMIPAHGNDFIGAVSANPSVAGNNAEMHWHGKYKTDVFGQAVCGSDGKPIISDEYKKQRYIPRSERPEWGLVGLVGRLVITDDGSCKAGGYVSARRGIGTSCYCRTIARVLRRIDDTHIEVLIK